MVGADAATYLSRLADRVDGLHLVALGPLTEVAEMQRSHPSSYERLAGIISMAGIVDADSHDAGLGVGEWNAAADADAFAQVVAGSAPLTIVPDDPVPYGRPADWRRPCVSRLGNDPTFAPPAFWDLATAGAFTTPARSTYESGTWEVDLDDDLGRLRRTGDGAGPGRDRSRQRPAGRVVRRRVRHGPQVSRSVSRRRRTITRPTRPMTRR